MTLSIKLGACVSSRIMGASADNCADGNSSLRLDTSCAARLLELSNFVFQERKRKFCFFQLYLSFASVGHVRRVLILSYFGAIAYLKIRNTLEAKLETSSFYFFFFFCSKVEYLRDEKLLR